MDIHIQIFHYPAGQTAIFHQYSIGIQPGPFNVLRFNQPSVLTMARNISVTARQNNIFHSDLFIPSEKTTGLSLLAQYDYIAEDFPQTAH